MSKRKGQRAGRGGSEHIGYGKPPTRTQFAKGRSGNPKGRPRGTKNLATVIAQSLNAKVPVHENGKRRRISKLEAAMTQLSNKAAMGDLKATQAALKLAQGAEDGSDNTHDDAPLTEIEEKVVQHLYQRIAMIIKGASNDPADKS